jgi:hypothetical protein
VGTVCWNQSISEIPLSTMSGSAQPMIRVLALCGFSQNKHVMHQRLGFLRKALKNKVEFGKSCGNTALSVAEI